MAGLQTPGLGSRDATPAPGGWSKRSACFVWTHVTHCRAAASVSGPTSPASAQLGSPLADPPSRHELPPRADHRPFLPLWAQHPSPLPSTPGRPAPLASLPFLPLPSELPGCPQPSHAPPRSALRQSPARVPRPLARPLFPGPAHHPSRPRYVTHEPWAPRPPHVMCPGPATLRLGVEGAAWGCLCGCPCPPAPPSRRTSPGG